MIVALIPARGGSKRIPRKNLQIVEGFSLVELAIFSAQGSPSIGEVYVSTDNPEIKEQALYWRARVVDRPYRLSGDDVPMEDVVSDFLLLEHHLETDDIVVLLEPTAPLRTTEDIEAIVELMRATRAPAARIVHVGGDECHGFVYTDAGLASAIRVGAFRRCLFPRGTLLLHRGDERGIDVDEPEDLERVRALA